MIPLYDWIILYTTQTWVCIVGIIGLIKYKRLVKPLRFLVWYILLFAGLDIVKDVLQYNNIRTHWLSQCFSVVELILFSTILYYWRTGKRNGYFIWVSFIIYLMIWIIGKFTFEPFTYADVYSGMVSQVIQIGFGVWLLLDILKEDSILWKNDPRFWIVSGIVLYASAVFFLFGMFNVMLTLPRQTMLLVWISNLIMLIIQYIFFLQGFRCNR